MPPEQVALTPRIISDFISPEEHALLLRWIDDVAPQVPLRINDQRFAVLGEIPSPPLAWELRTRIAELVGIDDIEEPVWSNLLSLGTGAPLEAHIDAPLRGLQNYRHIRCNVFLRAPAGGEPVVEQVTYPVVERSLLVFTPDALNHYHGRYDGDVHRAIISYGFVVVPGCRLFGDHRLARLQHPIRVDENAPIASERKTFQEVLSRPVWKDPLEA